MVIKPHSMFQKPVTRVSSNFLEYLPFKEFCSVLKTESGTAILDKVRRKKLMNFFDLSLVIQVDDTPLKIVWKKIRILTDFFPRL